MHSLIIQDSFMLINKYFPLLMVKISCLDLRWTNHHILCQVQIQCTASIWFKGALVSCNKSIFIQTVIGFCKILYSEQRNVILVVKVTHKQILRISFIHFWMLPFRELMLTFISSSRVFSMMLNSSTRSRHFSTWVWRLVRSSVSLSLRRMVKWVASLAHDFSLTWSFLAVVKLASSVTWWKTIIIFFVFSSIHKNYNKHISYQPSFC